MEQYIGVDVAKKRSHLTVMEADGTIRCSKSVANRPADLAAFFDQLEPGPRTAVLEACRDWAMVHDLLGEHVDAIKLAHPRKVRAIAEARIKNDRIDAETLAHLLRANLLPEAHIRAPHVRERQQWLRQYTFVTSMRTKVKQNIHVLIDRQAWTVRDEAAAFPSLFSRAGRVWLAAVDLPPHQRSLLDPLLALLDFLHGQVRLHRRWILREITADPDVQLLRSLPGLGVHWASVIAVEIDGIDRFASRDKLAAYAGLVPSTYASGETADHGRITKQGNRWLRVALVEAAWIAIRYDPQMRHRYQRLKAKKGAKKAVVAVARMLAERCWIVLHERRPYEIRPVPAQAETPERATTSRVAATLR